MLRTEVRTRALRSCLAVFGVSGASARCGVTAASLAWKASSTALRIGRGQSVLGGQAPPGSGKTTANSAQALLGGRGLADSRARFFLKFPLSDSRAASFPAPPIPAHLTNNLSTARPLARSRPAPGLIAFVEAL